MEERNKSRNQSLYDYLQCLQLEYITAELRSKTYPSVSDKKYYRKVMGYKEEKIIDISMRNQLPTIFNDNMIRTNLYKQVYVRFGCPEMIYKNDEEKALLLSKDLLNYFAVGAEIKIEKDGNVDVGIISDNCRLVNAVRDGDSDFSQIPLAVKKRNTQGDFVVLIKQVSRIL